jgi:hypothetical protein
MSELQPLDEGTGEREASAAPVPVSAPSVGGGGQHAHHVLSPIQV